MSDTCRLLSRLMLERQLTLAVAESVTAGYIQYLCSGAPDAASFFQGGITVYNCAQKFKHLGVEPVYALKNDGVSPAISSTLARNCCRLFSSHVGLGITGFADAQSSPENKACAFLSVWMVDKELIAEKLYSRASAFPEVQKDFSMQALDILTGALSGHPVHRLDN